MAVSIDDVLYDWKSGRIIGLFVCSGTLCIALGVQQEVLVFTTEARREFSVQYVRKKDIVSVFAQIACASINFFIAIYFIPIYF